MSINEGQLDSPSHPGTWTELSIYGTVDGLLTPGDLDWYRVYLQAGRAYTITMADRDDPARGNDFPFDSLLRLFTADGKFIMQGSEDNTGNPDDSLLTFTPSYSGIYYVQAGGSPFASQSTGSYTLTLTSSGQNLDVAETFATSSRLLLGQRTTGAVDLPTDVDLYRIDLIGNTLYDLRVLNPTVDDLQLALYSPSGALLTTLGSHEGFAVASSGTHFVGVYSGERTATGSYELLWSRPDATLSIVGNYDGSQSTASESAGSMTFTVNLSRPLLQSASVWIRSTTDITATTGADFQAVNQLIAFAPGETSKEITIPIANDAAAEPAEVFIVELYDSSLGVALATRTGYGYIFDNDFVPPSRDGAPLRDAFSSYQWYLYSGTGANVFPVWTEYSGAGVLVGVYDQGIDRNHPDLNDNLRTDLGRIAETLAPGGDPIYAGDNHGTAVAGVIAAERNGIGLMGLAFDADLVSVYSGLGTSSSENFSASLRNAFTYAATLDVLNDSWGYAPRQAWQTLNNPWAFYDNFRTLAFSAQGEALKAAAENGRDGLGTIVVQSAGNSYSIGDDTNLHNFQNSRYIITVAATDYRGHVTDYSSPGASVLLAAPGGGSEGWLSNIYTTDRLGAAGYEVSDYTTIRGTSFSAPIVSGVVALMLEANPNLGFRDVQQILAYSARITSPEYNTWAYNGARNWNGGGLHYDSITHDLGFGLVDAYAAVRLAEAWTAVPATAANDVELSTQVFRPAAIPDASLLGVTQSVIETRAIDVERIEVTLDVLHTYIGDLGIVLTSPAGTQSWLMYRPGVNELAPFGTEQDQIDFTFNTVLSMGESSVGEWKLTVIDYATQDAGELRSWKLNLIGKPVASDNTYFYTDEFAGAAQAQAARATLADDGGFDTLNAAAVTSASTLDLKPGATSSLAGASLTIDVATMIEAAIGGDGNDRITGNVADNLLRGMRGNDTLFGESGVDTLFGGAGDDVLWGGRGNDALDGGNGTDTAAFSGGYARFSVIRTATSLNVTDRAGTEGFDWLSGMEKLRFDDKTFDLVNPPRQGVPAFNTNNGFLFDAVFYLLDNAELVPTLNLSTALQHYFSTGAAQGRQPNSWFDPAYYENRWADLKAGNFDDAILFMHYNLYGVWEGRSAGPEFDKFDGNRYLTDNPDVAAYVDAHVADFLGSRTNGAIAHYVIYGAAEARLAFDLVGQSIDLGYTIDLGG